MREDLLLLKQANENLTYFRNVQKNKGYKFAESFFPLLNVSAKERAQMTNELDMALSQGPLDTRKFYQKWHKLITVNRHLKWGWMRDKIIETAERYGCNNHTINFDIIYSPENTSDTAETDEAHNANKEIFCRKLVKSLDRHLRFVRDVKLQDIMNKVENENSIFSTEYIKNSVKKIINDQYVEFMRGYNSNLLIQDLSKADIIKLRNAFRNHTETTLFYFANTLYSKYETNISKLSHRDSSYTHLCRGLALRILDYIRHQENPNSNELDVLVEEGVLNGRSETLDNLHLSLEDSDDPITISDLLSYNM